MRQKIKEYDRRLRRRLIYLLPVSVLLLIVIALSLERSRVVNRIFRVGYEGPMQILPEITILDDSGVEANAFQKEKHDMVARDVEIYSELKEDERENADIAPPKREEPEERVFDEFEGVDAIRTYRSHAPVPYREDYVITKMVEPVYPSDAMIQGREGYVLVEVYVDRGGRVQEAYVRKARGGRSFETATLEAVKMFEFRPVMERSEPVPFWVSFLVRFQLN